MFTTVPNRSMPMGVKSFYIDAGLLLCWSPILPEMTSTVPLIISIRESHVKYGPRIFKDYLRIYKQLSINETETSLYKQTDRQTLFI